MSRKSWPDDIRAQILIRSKRICALCFHFHGDTSVKVRGQIAHVDRDHNKSTCENGAYLCKDHHDEYDIKSTQSQRLNEAELKQAQADVYNFIEKGGLPTNLPKKFAMPRKVQPRSSVGSLAVYERRLPIYKATIEFIRYVVGDLKPEFPRIIQFGRDTEEAFFLFGDPIAAYLQELTMRAVRLQAVDKMRVAAGTGSDVGEFQTLVKEETELAMWFTGQYDVARAKFVPFLRLE